MELESSVETLEEITLRIAREIAKPTKTSFHSAIDSSGKYWIRTTTGAERLEKTFGDNFPKIRKGLILDWGCSTGDTTAWLAQHYSNSHLIGIDINREVIKEAQRKKLVFKNMQFLGSVENLIL